MADLGYPVYDADNHLYEPEEAFTRHLPRRFERDFYYVDVKGRRKLVIGGKLSEYIPNPTFAVVAAPGTHDVCAMGPGLPKRVLGYVCTRVCICGHR